MKAILILYLVFNISLIADNLPQQIDSNSSIYGIQDINITDEHVRSYLIKENNGTYSEQTVVDVNMSVSQYGNVRLPKGTNIGDSATLKGYTEKLKNITASQGISIMSVMSAEKYDATDTNSFTNDYIVEKRDINDTTKQAITTFDNFYSMVRSKAANLKTVECYVTRKLANSYYCPLPTMDHSFYYGGGYKDSKEEALERCNEDCKEPTTCISMDMNKPLETFLEPNSKISEGYEYIVLADSGMRPQYLELNIDNFYKYDENIDITSDDYNSTKAAEKLARIIPKFKIDISYYDTTTEKYVIALRGIEISAKELHNNKKLYLTQFQSSKFKITFYQSYVMNNLLEEYDANFSATLKNITLRYVDNKYWFCPTKHFVSNSADCAGELKTIITNATSYNVCVTAEGKQREELYGAFYTQEQCTNQCFLEDECKPTYRHLSNIDPLNLPSDVKDIEIGCVDTPSNTSCTKELCEQMFIEDKMPLKEKTWTNDDTVKVTVENGIPSNNLFRPRIDIEGGLSSNNNPDEKQKTSLNEMVELSYANMIQRDTYNISLYTIGTNIEKKYAHGKINNGDGSYSIDWKYKPKTHDYNEENFNHYVVFEIDTIYRPMYGFIQTEDQIMAGKEDPSIFASDKVYLVKTAFGFEMIEYIEMNELRLPERQSDDTIVYNWRSVDEYKNIRFVTFQNNDLLAYDVNSPAPIYLSKVFDKNKRYERERVFNNIEEVISDNGVIFQSQDPSGVTGLKRIYSGAQEVLESSSFKQMKIYGIYTKNTYTYSELLDALVEDDVFYSTSYKTSEVIQPDNKYESDFVNLYINGRGNSLNINADFTPSPEEEGKKTFIYMLLYDE